MSQRQSDYFFSLAKEAKCEGYTRWVTGEYEREKGKQMVRTQAVSEKVGLVEYERWTLNRAMKYQ